jgi:hypothetical protein
MFPNGNVGLENSKFYEDVPARGHLIGARGNRARCHRLPHGGATLRIARDSTCRDFGLWYSTTHKAAAH